MNHTPRLRLPLNLLSASAADLPTAAGFAHDVAAECNPEAADPAEPLATLDLAEVLEKLAAVEFVAGLEAAAATES